MSRLRPLSTAAALAAAWLVTGGAAARPPLTPAAQSPTEADLIARDAALRARRLEDLELLSRTEPRAHPRAEAQLALLETLAEEGRRQRDGKVPGPDDPGQQIRAAQAVEDQAIWTLDLLLRVPDMLPEPVRDRAWLLLAELQLREGGEQQALGALKMVEARSGHPGRRARAASRRGAILERREDDASQRVAYAARRVAFEAEPQLGRRFALARSAARVGRSEEAIAHYGALLQQLADATEPGAQNTRAFCAKGLAELLAGTRSPRAAAAYVEALGPAGAPLWRRLGIAHREARPRAAYAALDRARRLDPSAAHRADATARLVDLALTLERRDEVARSIAALIEALDGVDRQTMSGGRAHINAERVVKRVIELIDHEPAAAWDPADAEQIFAAYLATFAEARYAPTAYYVRGVHRARRAADCAGHRRAAQDFRRAFDRLEADDPAAAADAGRAMVRSLAACRPPWPPDDPRPPASPVDPALVSFGVRLLATDPSPPIAGEVAAHIGLAHLAADDLPAARAAFERAVGHAGEHLPGAAEQLLVTLELAGELDVYAERAGAFAEDPRLPPDRRADMQARVRGVAFVRARAVEEPTERAARLMDVVRLNAETATARDALIEAADAYGRAGDWIAARLALEDAVAREVTAGQIDRAHLELADLAARRGRFAEAAAHYTRWLDARDGPDDEHGARIRAYAVAAWQALGEIERALEVELMGAPAAERGERRFEAALAALERGDAAASARLLGGATDGGLRRAADFVSRCAAGDGPPRRPRGTTAARAERLVAACAVHRAEALLEERPDPAAGAEGLGALAELRDRLWRIANARSAAGYAEAARYGLVDARLVAAYAGLAAQAGDALDPRDAAAIAASTDTAWRDWRQLAADAAEWPVDGVYSARLGATLLDLVRAPPMEAP